MNELEWLRNTYEHIWLTIRLNNNTAIEKKDELKYIEEMNNKNLVHKENKKIIESRCIESWRTAYDADSNAGH